LSATRSVFLLWLERLLFAAGVALGAWCLTVPVQARLAQGQRARD
jgi:hypothetical protein